MQISMTARMLATGLALLAYGCLPGDPSQPPAMQRKGPELTSPAEGATTYPNMPFAFFMWKEDTLSSTYRLQLAFDAQFTQVAWSDTFHPGLSAFHQESRIPFFNDLPYWWRVRGESAIDTTLWSETRSFRTSAWIRLTSGNVFDWVVFSSPDQGFGVYHATFCSLGVGCSDIKKRRVSKDGGVTWAEVVLPEAISWPSDVSVGDPQALYACSPSGFGKSSDGGSTWTVTTEARGDEVHFLDANNGWVVKRTIVENIKDTIFQTSDGGIHWSIQLVQPPFARGFHDFVLLTASTAVGFASTGGILKTTDRGVTWSQRQAPDGTQPSAVYFQDSTKGWMVGGDATGNSSILRSVDGGETWTRIPSPTSSALSSIAFSDAQTGYAVGKTSADKPLLLATRDGGETWNPMGLDLYNTSQLKSVQFVGKAGWIHGNQNIFSSRRR
jgi:photosystem II stability/assembly factor-like uncharacterized protein